MQENISAYYKEQKTIWEENASLSIESFNEEAIHKMRTTTKRLRALFPFLKVISNGQFSGKKALKSIRGFYKNIGNIRELQLEQMLIPEYENKLGATFNLYKDFLSKKEQLEINHFQKIYGNFKPRDSKLPPFEDIEKLNMGTTGVITENAKLFLLKKSRRIHHYIVSPASHQNIHAVRRHLKQMYYLNDSTGSANNLYPESSLEQVRLREMEQYIGKWHDLLNSERFINDFFHSYNKPEDIYLKLKILINSERISMQQHIISIFYPELLKSILISE